MVYRYSLFSSRFRKKIAGIVLTANTLSAHSSSFHSTTSRRLISSFALPTRFRCSSSSLPRKNQKNTLNTKFLGASDLVWNFRHQHQVRTNVSRFDWQLLGRRDRAHDSVHTSYSLGENKTLRMVQGVPIEDGCIVNKNPATGEVLSKVPCTTLEQLDAAVQAAKAAQLAWSTTLDATQRVDLLRQGLAQLATKGNELAQWIVQEMGKPLAQAQAEVDGAVHKDEYLDLLVTALQPQQHGSSLVLRKPYGVVGILSPWNFPADEILLLALPALGSGNTVIVKPSEVAPETGKLVVETLASVLPAGVLQVVQGDGAVGAKLVEHKDVSLIAMTGSSATGKKIAQTAAQSLKRVVLELGGKDPMIVFADADLDAAAKDAVAYSLDNTGQVCCSIERIYVAESIFSEFEALVAKYAADYKVGNGLETDVTVGPMVSQMQKQHVADQVQDALSKGAKLVHQGTVPENAPPEASFYPVTVLSQVTETMNMYRDETFGPVVSLTPFDGSEETAVRLANDTNCKSCRKHRMIRQFFSFSRISLRDVNSWSEAFLTFVRVLLPHRQTVWQELCILKT